MPNPKKDRDFARNIANALESFSSGEIGTAKRKVIFIRINLRRNGIDDKIAIKRILKKIGF